MLKFSVADVGRATEGDVWPQQSDEIISAVVTDSRVTKPGNLFVALRGARYDGHEFVADALRAGAAAVMIEKSALNRLQADLRSANTPAIAVDDTLRALQLLAGWYRSRFTGPVVAYNGQQWQNNNQRSHRNRARNPLSSSGYARQSEQ